MHEDEDDIKALTIQGARSLILYRDSKESEENNIMTENPTGRVTCRGYETESDTDNNPSSNREELQGKMEQHGEHPAQRCKGGGNEHSV